MVVSDVRLYRDGLALCLADARQIEIVGTAHHGADALALITSERPDVALLDLVTLQDFASVRLLVDGTPGTRFVGLAVPALEHVILACAEAGIAGYVTPDGSLADLVATIQRVARGEALFPPRVVASMLRRLASSPAVAPARSTLTLRERQIATLLEDGLSNKEIAGRLSIELPTVKNHVHHILEKLGAHRRGEAVAKLRGESLAPAAGD